MNSLFIVTKINQGLSIEVKLCFGTQCSLCSSQPACEVIHPSFFNKILLYNSFTSPDPTLDPLTLVIFSTLFYMYRLDKRGHHMWRYFTCKHVSLLKNSIHYMYVSKFIYNEYIRPYFLSLVVSTTFTSDPRPPEVECYIVIALCNSK